jgi:8-amino-7-oxononanoate synthase
MADFFPWMKDELLWLAEQGLVRERRTVLRRPGGRCEVGGRELCDFASNDYLGLSQDPLVIESARSAAAECGAGSGGSSLVVGRSPWHARLEERLARFEGQEAALLFPTGFAANVGTIAALVERDDLICSDRLNHASLIDGCRLSGAEVYVYDRDRLERLDGRLLAAYDVRRKLIVTDGVFSMDGVLAPLGELCELAARHGAMLLVDEAHGTGVFGPRGRGVCELAEVEDKVAVRVGTLSKAVGSLGGFVTGSRLLVDWLWNRARTQIFSTAAPPSACAAAYAALDIIEAEPQRREKVLALSQHLRRGMAERRLETVDGGTGPIVPILCNEPDAAVYFARRLEQSGFLVGAMRPPSVPSGTSRVRIGVTAAHSAEDIVSLLRALEEISWEMSENRVAFDKGSA